MLSAFSLENYRSFAAETRIELRPLTLLYGRNNAGKSALVRALALIFDSMRADAPGPLNLDSSAVRDGVFGDLVSKLSDFKTIKLKLEYDSGLGTEYEVTKPTGSLRQSLTTARVTDGEGCTLNVELLPAPAGVEVATYRLVVNGQLRNTHVKAPFVGLAPVIDNPFVPLNFRPGLTAESQAQYVAMVGDWISETRNPNQFLWLGSLRSGLARFVRIREGGAPPRLQSDGARVVQVLALDKLAGGSLLADVSAWYERADCFKRRLNVVQAHDNMFSLVLEPVDAKRSLQVNVIDTGEGIAQVLPILVAAAAARQGGPTGPRILAFEQPELHLHTAIHAPLAEHLCSLAASENPPRMLIETHSENFLLGVQIQVAKGLLRHDRVLIYWVEQDDNGESRVTRVELDKEGYARGFPSEVFDKDVELSRILLEAREGSGG